MPQANASQAAQLTVEEVSLTRDQLIERHLPLVTFTVNRMSEFLGSGIMEREDAIGYGSKGLIAAVDNYDPTKGASFASYAILRIRGAILDAAREMDAHTRSERRNIRAVESVSWELAAVLGRWPTVKELALKTGYSIADIQRLQSERGAGTHSLDQSLLGGDEALVLQVEDPDETVNPAAVADRKAVVKLLHTAVNVLGARDRQIIHMRYSKELPFHVIGKQLSISESRVCQLHTRIIARLRSHLENDNAQAA